MGTRSGTSRFSGFIAQAIGNWGSGASKARVDDLLTPYPQIVEELERRSKDEKLKAKVEAYLKGDIPEYFKGKPALYLARHLATRNFETLRFLHILEPLDLPVVIGQDTHDIFVAHNPLKRALGKLPICMSVHHKNGRVIEEYKNISIINFNEANGKPFKDIYTCWGEPLVEFHGRLLEKCQRDGAQVVDDAAWIDRHHRRDLLAHYKDFLALFVAHGVLFEDYLIEDKHEGRFIREVLRPAFRHVERTFGVRPLIAQLKPTSAESDRYWISYPRSVFDEVCTKLESTP